MELHESLRGESSSFLWTYKKMQSILEAKNLHKTFEKSLQKIDVLKGVSFSLHKGEPVVFEGASGAGKSTLLHILGGLDKPSEGSVFFEGEDLFQKNEKQLSQFRNKALGFIFQFHHLLPLFTAVENVMMPALIAGLPKVEARENAEKLLNDVGLSHRFTHRPTELSGGEQQRVAIARALVMKPKLLMADEPTGNLDAENSKKIFELLLSMTAHYQTTLLVVTHNDELASKLTRRIRIQDGKIV